MKDPNIFDLPKLRQAEAPVAAQFSVFLVVE